MIEVPQHFFEVWYDHECYPGSAAAKRLSNGPAGANCQHFAYELLRWHGKELLNFRSRELWEDVTWTMKVDSYQPLDLMLYNSKNEAFGAHLALVLDDDKFIHLSKELGHAVIWGQQQFLEKPAYRYFLGAKRIRAGITCSIGLTKGDE